MLVKICGVKTPEAAEVALDAGADMIGMIFVPGRSRTVTVAEAQSVAKAVHNHKRYLEAQPSDTTATQGATGLAVRTEIFEKQASAQPRLVGVFQNQTEADILAVLANVDLDVVQLHGLEDPSLAGRLPVPVIKKFTPGQAGFSDWQASGSHSLVLFDSAAGGTGEKVDWTSLSPSANEGARFLLAGGLTPDNVAEAASVPGVLGVDVSGGVETAGAKDLNKIRAFVANAKAAVA